MTTGELIFYAGVVLLVTTIITAIIFVVKKPQYNPDKEIYRLHESGTEPLLNSYPTEPLTIRKTGMEKTESVDNLEIKPIAQETMPLELSTVPLEDVSNETVLLDDTACNATVLLDNETEVLEKDV